MRLLARFFGRSPPSVPAQPALRPGDAMRDQTRRELVSMALRDTLKKHGIRSTCITADGLTGMSPSRERGLHIQLVFREWDPALIGYVVALEAMVRRRLLRLDPLAAAWVLGMSWKFAPVDASKWPQLPASGPLHPPRPSPAPGAGTGAASLEHLLEARDASYAKASRAQDFSPTLPM